MAKHTTGIRRGILGPYSGIRPLTKKEVDIYCDGDRATRLFRDSVILRNGVLYMLTSPQPKQTVRMRLNRVMTGFLAIWRY